MKTTSIRFRPNPVLTARSAIHPPSGNPMRPATPVNIAVSAAFRNEPSAPAETIEIASEAEEPQIPEHRDGRQIKQEQIGVVDRSRNLAGFASVDISDQAQCQQKVSKAATPPAGQAQALRQQEYPEDQHKRRWRNRRRSLSRRRRGCREGSASATTPCASSLPPRTQDREDKERHAPGLIVARATGRDISMIQAPPSVAKVIPHAQADHHHAHRGRCARQAAWSRRPHRTVVGNTAPRQCS